MISYDLGKMILLRFWLIGNQKIVKFDHLLLIIKSLRCNQHLYLIIQDIHFNTVVFDRWIRCHNQYDVGPPLFRITSRILSGILTYKFLMYSELPRNASQFLTNVGSSGDTFRGNIVVQFRVISIKKFPIGFKSGLCGGSINGAISGWSENQLRVNGQQYGMQHYPKK